MWYIWTDQRWEPWPGAIFRLGTVIEARGVQTSSPCVESNRTIHKCVQWYKRERRQYTIDVENDSQHADVSFAHKMRNAFELQVTLTSASRVEKAGLISSDADAEMRKRKCRGRRGRPKRGRGGAGVRRGEGRGFEIGLTSLESCEKVSKNSSSGCTAMPTRP